MKHSQNNLSVILTYAVPTAAALLGLLWLLRRKKGKDEDDDMPPAADASTPARKERSGIVTAPNTFPKEHRVGDEVLEKRKAAPSHVSVGDGSAQKTPSKQTRPGAGIMKTPASDGRALGAGDRLPGSVHVSTCSTTTVSSSASSAPSDRQDQSAAAAHSFKVSSVLSSILPASSTGVEKDPVQVLVSSNEAKLKQDDASIVQAKLSTSTLHSLPPSSSTTPSSICSSDPSQANVQKDSSQNPQEALFAKEIVQEVLSQAARVHAHSLTAASATAKSGPCATDTTAGRSNTPSTVTSILKQSALKDSQLESPGRLGGTSLESVGTTCPTGSQGNSESSSRNSNSNSNNSGSSTQESESLSRVAVSRAEILLQKTSSGEKIENRISKQESDQKDPSNKKHETVSESGSSSTARVSIESKSASVKPSSESASVRDLKSSTDATEVVQNKDTVSDKGSSSKASVKSPPAKDGRSNQGAQSKDKSSSSSVKTASPSAGAKASSQKQTGKAASKSEKQPSNQSKTPSQQKTKPAPSSNNSYSSKRRTRSGGSTGDVASDVSPESHDSGGQASPGVMENGRLPDSGSPVCDTNSEASNDSGRGGSVGESLVPLSGGEVVRYEFNFPSDLCGRLIGRGGKNIQQIKDQSGANVTLSSNPFTPEFQICCVQGMQPEVDRALMLIRKKFPLAQYPHLDMVSLAPIPPPAPVVLPEIMQLNLPEGVSVDIVVSAIVNAGHIFVQQPTHPTFPSLERLNHFMNACYGDQNVPLLPRPVEGGIICAAESEGQWYRAQVVQVYPVEDECDIKYVDYGGYTRVPVNTLKQIRSDFMTLPFQAVECYLANITPLQEEEYFSDRAGEVLAELTSGKMLQGQVIARGEDSICYVHLYQVSGHSVLMINREMVNREVVRWIEVL